MDYLPDQKTYILDEVLVFDSLRVSIHTWAEQFNEIRDVGWIDFKVLEHERVEAGKPIYPTDTHRRPSRDGGTEDARAAKDWIAEGFLKWDGCCEIALDHHFCGLRNYLNVVKAIANLFAWAGEEFGFEECSEPVNPKGEPDEP